MPFFDSDGAPLTSVLLRYVGGRRFQVVAPFAWVDPRNGQRFIVPAQDPLRSPADPDNSTDLASVPPFLWGLVSSYGRQTLPAILHDHLTAQVRLSPAPGRRQRQEAADDRFRVALRECGVTDSRSSVMWAVVRIAGYLANAPALGVGLVALIVLSSAVSVAAIVLGVTSGPLWLLGLLLPGVASFGWGRRAGLAAVAAYAGALYLPLVATAGVVASVQFLIALVLYAAGGRRGATPRPGPLLRRPTPPAPPPGS